MDGKHNRFLQIDVPKLGLIQIRKAAALAKSPKVSPYGCCQ